MGNLPNGGGDGVRVRGLTDGSEWRDIRSVRTGKTMARPPVGGMLQPRKSVLATNSYFADT